MKLNAYTDNVNLNTIGNAHYNVQHKEGVYGQSAPSLTGVIGNALSTIAQVQEQKFDEQNKLALMNAKSDYQRKMNEFKTNLLLTKEAGAVGSTDALQKFQQELRKETVAQLPQYEHVVGAFDVFANDVDSKDHEEVYKHQAKEYDAYKKTSLKASNQVIGDSLYHANTPEDAENLVKEMYANTVLVYGNQGEGKVATEMTASLTKMMTPVINQAMQDKDYEKAYSMIEIGRKYGMDEGSALKLLVDTNEHVVTEDLDKIVDAAMARFPNDKERQRAMIDEILAKNSSTEVDNTNNVMKVISSQLNLKYKLGGNRADGFSDCGDFTQFTINKSGGNLESREADRQYLQLEQEGKIVPLSQAKNGDLVFWHVPGSRWETTNDPNAISPTRAYKGITHVGIFMNGEVYQMGETGLKPIPADTYEVVGCGRALDGNSSLIKERTNKEYREKAYKMLDDKYTKKENDWRTKDTQTERMMKDIVNNTIVNGGSIASIIPQLKSMVTPDLMGGKSGSLLARLMKGSDEETATGSKGGALAPQQKRMFISTLLKGARDHQGYMKLIDEIDKETRAATGQGLSIKQQMEMMQLVEDRENGTGVFKVDIDGAIADSKIEPRILKAFKPQIYDLVVEQVLDYTYEHGGDTPKHGELKAMVKKATEEKDIELTSSPRDIFHGYSPEKYVDIIPNVSKAELKAYGLDLEPVGNNYVRVYRNGVHDTDVHISKMKEYLKKYGFRDL